MARAQYKTKQMTELLAFLKSVQGSHVTVKDICACIHQAEQTLRNLGTGNIGNAVVSTLPVWNGILLPVCLFCVYTTSLVSQKVRLND